MGRSHLDGCLPEVAWAGGVGGLCGTFQQFFMLLILAELLLGTYWQLIKDYII